MNERPKFGQWFRMQREDRQWTEDQAAEHLDLSLPTILRIEGGSLAWAQLPPDIKKKIESKFGEYQESGLLEGQEPLTSYRQAEAAYSTPYLVDIREDILRELESLEIKPEPPELEQSAPASELAAIEDYCSRCRAPVQIGDEGRCPNCGRLGDGSQ